MAEIKSINGYNLKDEKARSEIAKKAGMDHTHDKLHNHENKGVLDTISNGLVEEWNGAAAKVHSHDNGDILSSITAEKVTAWNSLLGENEPEVTYKWENVYDSSAAAQKVILNQGGGTSPANGYAVTDYIPMKNGDVFNIGITYGWAATVYAMYSSSKTFIKAYTTPSTDGHYETVRDVTVDSESCAYIRVSIPMDKLNTATIKKRYSVIVHKEQPLDNIIQSGGYASVFPKIACIGDSLTYGALEWTAESGISGVGSQTELYSYPACLQRMCQNTVYNFGSSGAHAKESETSSDSGWTNIWLKCAQWHSWLTEEKKADAYIIALGTNDIGILGGFDGEVSTDIDTADYNNNGVTSVGGYAKIIQKIKELVPKAKIFCCTIPNSRNSAAARRTANTKIRAIAELFGCYVIDLERYYVSEDEVEDYKAKYYSVGHLNCLGYKRFADAVASYVDWYVRTYPEKFYDVPAIGV